MAVYKNISIKNKLITIQLITSFIAVLICCVLFVFNDIKTFNKSMVDNKNSIAEIVGVNAISPLLFNDKDAATQILMNLKSNPSILNAAIFDKDGAKFAQYDANRIPFLFPPPSTEEPTEEADFIDRKFLVVYPISQNGEFIGTVMIRSSVAAFNEILINYIKVAGSVLLGALLIAFIFSAFFQQQITQRIQSLMNKAKEITSTGNYSNRVYIGGLDEIGALSKEFNNMLDQIQKMQNSLKDANVDLEQRVKERTAKLERSNQELEQFAYVASHDLQEPLRTISNFVGLLEKKYPKSEDEDGYRYFQFIMKATSRMQNLIKDLLEISRVGRNVQFTIVDCNKTMLDLMAEMEISIKENNAAIHFDGLPVLIASEIELKRIFQNLISNALKFKNKTEAPSITVTVQENENEYIFMVEDNGIGIPAEYTNKIFNIFQRLHSNTEYPGTGIGLATCKKIALLHNGNIWVESTLGVGTTFYFSISKHITSSIN
ncbi:MAG TPA: ATP-binding protein [Bacteroidia bacterium]|jgi:signal transduction histidine kinase|nr:ATP-binding protein [Bacteroidia bacterium]